MARTDKTHIMVHCSATKANWMHTQPLSAKVDEIRRWHVQERGWSDIGYTFIIDRNGKWTGARDLDKDGDFIEETNAAAVGWNKKAVHICLLGGHGASANDSFDDHFTMAQDKALRECIKYVNQSLGRELKLIGHNETAAKGCPGFQVRPWYNGTKPRTNPVESTTVGATGVGSISAVATGVSAVGSLDGNAQLVALVGTFVALACFAYIFRERIKKWAAGVR